MTTETIDLTPTWAGILPLLTAGIEAGGTAYSSSMRQMYDMAELADRWNAAVPALVDALTAILPDYVQLIDQAHDTGADDQWAGEAKARAYAAILALTAGGFRDPDASEGSN